MSKSKTVFHGTMLLIAGSALILTACSPAKEETNSAAKGAESAAQSETSNPVKLPDEWAARRDQQLELAKEMKAFHDFRFTDEFEASGITFHHHITEDSGKNWKPVHYDHGSGVAVADVDGDKILDIYFMSQIGGNELWRGLGNGKFENITAAAGVAMETKVSVAAAFGDIDNDGDADLFVTTVKMGNQLFENDGSGHFTDISKEATVDAPIRHSSGAIFFDYDNDGLLDLYVASVGVYTTDEKGTGGFYLGLDSGFVGHTMKERYEKSLFYRNLGGNRFEEIGQEVGLTDDGWNGDASICDLNNDGFMDLYILNMQGDDHFYENQSGRRFKDRTADYFPKTSWGAMGVKIFDYDNDGDFDIMTTDMHSDMTDSQTNDGKTDTTLDFEKLKSDSWCGIEWTDEFLLGADNNVFGNCFYRNNGDGTFTEISDENGTETYWPWGVSAGDINADGLPDLFVTGGMGSSFRYGINDMLINDDGHFYDSEYVVGIEPRLNGRMQKTGFVLDCDGVDQDHSLCAGLTGRHRVREALSTRSSVFFDLDNDGDLDLVTNEMNDRPQIFVSDLTDHKDINFVKVSLVGTASNRDAIGAVVKVKTGGLTQTQRNDGNTGYLGQSLAPLYFGLGASKSIDSIEVSWPSGKTQTVTGADANDTVLITEKG